MTSDQEISPPSLAFKMEMELYRGQIPQAAGRKEFSSENNKKVTEVW